MLRWNFRQAGWLFGSGGSTALRDIFLEKGLLLRPLGNTGLSNAALLHCGEELGRFHEGIRNAAVEF
jgi:hypothetical protein